MKLNFLLSAILLIAFVAALLLPRLTTPRRKESWRSLRKARVRRFSPVECIVVPFVMSLRMFASRFNGPPGGNRIALANALLTYPECGDTALADEAIGRYKIIKKGTDIYHKGLCDKGDIPEGFTRDASAAAAEDRFAFDYFGLARKGSEATASGTCTAGNLCCPGDDGTIRDITTVSSETVYVCGKLMTTATTGNQVVFIPYSPFKLVIA